MYWICATKFSDIYALNCQRLFSSVNNCSALSEFVLHSCSHHPAPHCHWHGSWTGVWWAEGGSWESRPKGGAPPAARAHATKSHHIFLHSRTFSPQTTVTFSYVPAHIFLRIFRFEQSRTNTVHARRGLGKGHCAVVVASQAILHPSACRTILHNSTYTTLHPSACLAILQLCRNPTFPCNSPQIWQNLLKDPFSVGTKAKPC